MSLIQDIPTFDGQDTTKLEDWLSDIEMAADILKESQACLAKVKSCGLTHTLIYEMPQAEKCWDDIKDALHLKLCNTKIHTYTSHFLEIQQRAMKLWQPMYTDLRQKPRGLISTVTLLLFGSLLKSLGHT